MLFNVAFNNISFISWQSVLLVEKTTDLPQVRQTLEFELTTLVVIDTDCIGSYKSNYHTITTTTALNDIEVYSSTQ